MTYGVTAAGFIRKRLADVKAEMEQAYRDTFGNGVDLSEASPFGQMIAIHSEREALLWELAEDVYNSQYPDTATGVSLDNAIAFTGHRRKGKTKSRVQATFTGTPETNIPKDFVVYVDGNPSARFLTEGPLTIGVGGTVTGWMVAAEAGAVQAPAGSLTEIETPLAGLDSVTNNEAADVGEEIEEDAALKQRRNESLARSGDATSDAIRADVLAVNGVTTCTVLNNRTMETNENGQPPKSFWVIVQGGDDEAIARAIFDSMPAGIQPYGDVLIDVEDSEGTLHEVGFSRPFDLDIYLELDLTVDSSFPGADVVKAAIMDFGESLELGEDVVVFPQLVGALADIPGILDVVIRIGTAAEPTTDDNIPVSEFQRATFALDRIEVTTA